MSNPNPNLISVWSPDGSEMIETSRANARDLVSHVGWSYSPPHVIEKIVVVEKEATHEVGETKTETPTTTETEEVIETPAEDEDAGEEESAEEEPSGEAPAVRKTEEDFADLETREDVVAYLATAFPSFKPHHLAKRDGLVAKAIELANA